MRSLRVIFDRFEAEGTVFGSISKNDFRSIRRVMPPRQLVATFERVAAPIDQRILTGEHESQTLSALRDALLPKLISGKLCIKDAERAVEATA
jgi:type I restriction enzyme S subunit